MSDLPSAIVRQYLPFIKWRRQMQKQQRKNFAEKYPEDPLTAFLVSGKQYFDRDILIARKQELIGFKPWRTMREGEGQIFHRRAANRRYVIGADVATGREISSEDTDYCAAVVIDLEDGQEMGSIRAKMTPQEFALDLNEMGRYFNTALIGVERTGDGGTTVLTLAGEMQYPSIYKHREWHKRERKKVIEFEGFPTTPKTRPIALSFLRQQIDDAPDTIFDVGFINEALVFVRDERGIPAAQVGSHDDRVSARWVAHAVRRTVLGYWDPLSALRRTYGEADGSEEDAA